MFDLSLHNMCMVEIYACHRLLLHDCSCTNGLKYREELVVGYVF